MRVYAKYAPGMRFGKLTLVERTDSSRIWRCVCDCGETVYTQVSHGSRSCRKCAYDILAKNRIIHGESNDTEGHCTRLYRIWTGMKTRCHNPKNHTFKEYGQRGIALCGEWNSYVVFRDWAITNGYTDGLTIDRIDVNGNYEPSNCRWVTSKEQMANTRRNRVITIDGQTMIFTEWLLKLGLWKPNVYSCAKRRGISVEEYLEIRYRQLET